MPCKHGLNAHKQHIHHLGTMQFRGENAQSHLGTMQFQGENAQSHLGTMQFWGKMHNPTSVQCSFGVLVVVHKSLLDWRNSSLLVLRHARCLHAGALC